MKRLSALAAGLLAVLLVAATFAVGELRAQAKPASMDASVDDIAQAGALVRGVSGVSAVRNGLRVQNRPSQA